MSTTTIPCPHCGRNTRINLRMDFSLQKCGRCGIRLTAVNTGLTTSQEVKPENMPARHKARVGDWNEERVNPTEENSFLPASARKWAWAFLGLVVVGAGVGIWWLALSGPSAPPAPPMVGLSGDSSAMVEGQSTYEENKERMDAACRAAEVYLAAKTVDELLPLIQNREALEARVRSFYAGPEGKGLLPLPPCTLAPLDRHMWVARIQSVIVTYDVPDQLPRALALKKDPDGRWLVDWPSAVALNEVPWADFVAKKDTTPRLFRVLTAQDDYYNHQFSNAKHYHCFKLTDPMRQQLLYGYVEVDSPAAKELLQYPLPLRNNGVPMLMRLKFPENAPAADQVEILGPIFPGWILPESEQEPGAAVASSASGMPEGEGAEPPKAEKN